MSSKKDPPALDPDALEKDEDHRLIPSAHPRITRCILMGADEQAMDIIENSILLVLERIRLFCDRFD